MEYEVGEILHGVDVTGEGSDEVTETDLFVDNQPIDDAPISPSELFIISAFSVWLGLIDRQLDFNQYGWLANFHSFL